MGTDNVDVFRKIVFSLPETRVTAGAILAAGAASGGAAYAALKAFSSNLMNVSGIGPEAIPVIGALFIVPTLISGEVLPRVLPDYPRKWSYFLGLSNQILLFIYALIFTGANTVPRAWQVFWLALATVFTANLLVLTLTLGYKNIRRVTASSMVQPTAVAALFQLTAAGMMTFPPNFYTSTLASIGFACLMLLVAFGAVEYLLRANVEGISVVGLTSGLLQKRQESLDLGHPSKVEVQTLELENEHGEAEILAPWIHPGPLEGFGGGKVTGKIIESLNQSGEGFFLHVPSTHKSDPASPDCHRKILDAANEPERNGKASRMISREYEDVTFHGRRIDGKKMVFLDTNEESDLDDYEVSIFREVIDLEEVMLVDLHNHEYGSPAREAWYGTEECRRLRDSLEDFLERLDGEELHGYRAGFKSSTDGTPSFALVERVGGQETLIFGIEGNEATQEIRKLEEEYSDDYDRALAFTTDTHRSIHQMSSKTQCDPEKVRGTVRSASETVSESRAGFSVSKTEPIRLLKEDYLGLVFSINILVRLIPLSLVLAYLLLIVWIF
ncbi:MAG: DUF2070 family protein [Candidatus Nanohaloarchaea archaeon]